METYGTNGINPEPAKPSTFQAIRNRVQADISGLAHALLASERPLPTETNDGTFPNPRPSALNGILSDLKTLNFQDIGALLETAKAEVTKEPTNDRTMLLEKLLQVSG